MPRQTIRKLSVDVERVLVAGAHLAAADPELARDKAALDNLAKQLGARAPAIGQLAQATGEAIAASGPAAAKALVQLAAMVGQVRAAQAEVAPLEGELRPIEAVPPLETPCNARDLYELHGALVETGQGRAEKVNEAIERGDIADLRLVEDVLQAMGDSWIGETVADKAVPLFGKAIVAPVRARLRLEKGRAVDGRRLRALVAVEKAGARDLLEQAVKTGSAEIREAALDAMGDHVHGLAELEPLVLGVLEKERTGDVKRAALRALAGYGSDAALEALLEGLDSPTTLHAAAEGLSTSTHPKVIDKLLARLAETLAAKPEKKKASTSKTPAKAKKTTTKDETVEWRRQIEAILGALACHKAPAIASAALELVPTFGAPAARAVVASGDKKQLAAIADLLDGGKERPLFEPAVAAAWALGADEAYKRLTAVFKAKDRETDAGKARMDTVADSIQPGVEKRWIDFLIAVAAKEPREVAGYAVPVLGRLKEKRAVKPLVERLEDEKQSNLADVIIRALGGLGDRVALEPILERLESSRSSRWSCYYAILELADETTVDRVRTLVAKQKNPDWYLTGLLHRLEQRFPGK